MEQAINEMGQLPDWTSGRRWLIENYESYHSRFVTALDFWARNVKNVYEINMKLWQSMNRVMMLVKFRKPITEMSNYKEITTKWDSYNKIAKVPTKETLLEFASFLDEALYKLKVVYDEETEREPLKAYWRGKQF